MMAMNRAMKKKLVGNRTLSMFQLLLKQCP
jgi:hypothetical protein